MDFIITTSPIIDNCTITKYLGPIISSEVLGVNVISDSIASFSDFFGGASGTYRSKLEDLKRTVLEDLKKKALYLGANAIVGFNISFNEISGKGKQMFMATAIGTAVKLSHNRFDFARKMHELMMYHEEGIYSDAEFEHEVDILKSSVNNVVEIENRKFEEQKRAEELEKKLLEEEQKRKEEYKIKIEEERLKFHEKYGDVLQLINNEFEKHKEDVLKLDVQQIKSASYNDILPVGELSHYDIMRYFISIGRADAAGKFYIDKFNLSAEEALQYLYYICELQPQ